MPLVKSSACAGATVTTICAGAGEDSDWPLVGVGTLVVAWSRAGFSPDSGRASQIAATTPQSSNRRASHTSLTAVLCRDEGGGGMVCPARYGTVGGTAAG